MEDSGQPWGRTTPERDDTGAPQSEGPSPLAGLVIGMLAGSLSGLFGVGGGILIVPALAIFGRMEQRVAHGTSLAATAPLALAGLLGYATAGQVNWTVGALLLSGSVIGAIVGTDLLKRISGKWLAYGFVALLFVTAARMLVDTPEGQGISGLQLADALGLGGVGLFSGSIAGLMGVGGGIVMVPAQTVLFSMTAAVAKGTSLAVIVPTAVVGTYRNLRNSNADMPTATRVGLTGAIFSFLAARVSIGLDPRLSAVLFAVLLALAAGRLLWRTISQDRQPSEVVP